jgi:hypothetical protein
MNSPIVRWNELYVTTRYCPGRVHNTDIGQGHTSFHEVYHEQSTHDVSGGYIGPSHIYRHSQPWSSWRVGNGASAHGQNAIP